MITPLMAEGIRGSGKSAWIETMYDKLFKTCTICDIEFDSFDDWLEHQQTEHGLMIPVWGIPNLENEYYKIGDKKKDE